MLKQLIVTALLSLSAVGLQAQTAATKSLYRTITDTYETKADSMTNAFIESFMVKSKGYFNVSYQKYAFNAYWTQAHAMDVVIYNYERHKGIDKTLANKYLSYMKLWYNNKANNYSGGALGTGYKMFENPYTDDMCWITLTLLHMTEATGLSTYATAARNVFDKFIITRASEDEETGGLWLPWNTDAGSGPNACTQSPATLIAAKLYQKYGDEKYLEYAKKLYAYTAKKIVKSDGRVEEPPLTYTQGTFGEACRILFHVTDEASSIRNKYRTLAFTYLNYAFTSGRCTNGSNILRHEGTSGDQSIFKAVLIPYAVNFVLDEDMSSANRLALCKLIQKNTTTLWKNLDFGRYPIVFCNFDWTKPWDGADSDASMGAMCSGSSLIENTARMHFTIKNRYDLAALYTECSSLTIDTLDTEFAAFTTAMNKASEIIAEPGSYKALDFKNAIEDLKEAYAAAQEYTATIDEIGVTDRDNATGIYDLKGKLVRTPWQGTHGLPHGIYIINKKKVLVP